MRKAAEDGRSDADLIKAYLSGERDAFRILYGRHHSRLYVFANRKLGDSARAEEVVQDGWRQIYRHLHRFDPEVGSFSTWAHVIVGRLVTNVHKKRYRSPITYFEAITSNSAEEDEQERQFADRSYLPDRLTERREVRRKVEAALEEIRPAHASVVRMYHLEGRSYREIAKETDVPLGTVKSRLARGRQELREKLQKRFASAA